MQTFNNTTTLFWTRLFYAVCIMAELVLIAANPEAETKRLPDTEDMHDRTRELLRKIDRERLLVSLFAEPTNLFNPDCIMAFSRGKRIGRVAEECDESHTEYK